MTEIERAIRVLGRLAHDAAGWEWTGAETEPPRDLTERLNEAICELIGVEAYDALQEQYQKRGPVAFDTYGKKTYQVSVMVTVQTDQPVTRGPDSYELAELLHDRMMNDPKYDFGTIISIDGIPADETDPNSPPVSGAWVEPPTNFDEGVVD